MGIKTKNKTPPVTTGQKLRLTATGIGSKGDALTKMDGFVIFIPHGKFKETYEVEIGEVKENCAYAIILKQVR